MAKQIFEGLVSASLRAKNKWYLKLQVTPLSHHKMPADFIIVDNKTKLLECKQISIGEKFYFNRLTQELELVKFSRVGESWVGLFFFRGKTKDSDVYFLTIDEYEKIKASKDSYLDTEDLKYFKKYRVKKGLIVDFPL